MSTIMVVDDSEVLHSLLTEFLTSHGFEVMRAEHAQQAYELLQTKIPDLILLDMQLPDVSGLQLLKLLRNRVEMQNVPIIVITATATQVEDRVRGLQAGADDYLLKPFELSELLERVRAVLRRTGPRPARVEPTEMALAIAPPIEEAPRLHPLEAIRETLFEPFNTPVDRRLPSLALPFIGAMMVLLFAAYAGAAGVAMRPLLVLVATVVTWATAVTTLAMTASFAGLHMRWREAADLGALAGLPLLLKWAGAALFSLTTTLAPFYYSAGPVLALGNYTFWWARLDLFELWSVALLWIFLRRRPKGSALSASIISASVWLAIVGMVFAVSKFGSAG